MRQDEDPVDNRALSGRRRLQRRPVLGEIEGRLVRQRQRIGQRVESPLQTGSPAFGLAAESGCVAEMRSVFSMHGSIKTGLASCCTWITSA